MVISDTVICNFALNLLGVEEIASINESSRAANVCKTAYYLTKEALLRSHFWNFAITRVILSPDATPPAFGYAYKFSLPSDALVWKFVDNVNDVKQEGRKLLTNDPTLKLIYVTNAVTEADFDPLFARTFAARLAADTCNKLTNNVSLGQKVEKEFSDLIKEARRMNAISQTPDGLVVETLTNVRL